MTHIIALAIIAVGTLIFASPSSACGHGPQISFAQPSPVAYTEAGANFTVPATITFPNGFHGSCFVSAVINNAPYLFQNILHSPQSSNGLTIHVLSPFWFSGTEYVTQFTGMQNQNLTMDIPLSIPANQLGRAAGTYQNTFTLHLKNIMGGTFQSLPLVISAHIQPSCTLPPPSVASLDFSAGIHNGIVTMPVQHTLTFNNAGCTGPARLSLSGQPLRLSNNPIAALHFTSTATLGSNSVNLDTRQNTSAFTIANSAPASGTIPLSITLLPNGNRLPAGTYSSVLTVSLEPAQ